MANLPANEVGDYLVEVIKSGSLCNYGDIVNDFDLTPLTDNWTGSDLAKIFEILDQEDANRGRPFRTSVVVSKESNVPGSGYFEALGRLKGKHTYNQSQRDQVWIEELNEARNHNWG